MSQHQLRTRAQRARDSMGASPSPPAASSPATRARKKADMGMASSPAAEKSTPTPAVFSTNGRLPIRGTATFILFVGTWITSMLSPLLLLLPLLDTNNTMLWVPPVVGIILALAAFMPDALFGGAPDEERSVRSIISDELNYGLMKYFEEVQIGTHITILNITAQYFQYQKRPSQNVITNSSIIILSHTIYFVCMVLINKNTQFTKIKNSSLSRKSKSIQTLFFYLYILMVFSQLVGLFSFVVENFVKCVADFASQLLCAIRLFLGMYREETFYISINMNMNMSNVRNRIRKCQDPTILVVCSTDHLNGSNLSFIS